MRIISESENEVPHPKASLVLEDLHGIPDPLIIGTAQSAVISSVGLYVCFGFYSGQQFILSTSLFG